MRPDEGKGWAAAGVTIVLWASAFPAIRAAVEDLDVGHLTVARLLVASLVLLVAVPFVRLRVPARRDLPWLLLAGTCGMAGYQLLLNAGEVTVSAGAASLLVNTAPVFTALLAVRLLGERLTARAWSGIALGFAGATLLALTQGEGISVSAGALLVLAAALALASFFILQKQLVGHLSAFEVTAYATWLSTLTVLPLAIGLPGALRDTDAEVLAAVLFLGAGSSALGFFTWAYATSRLDVGKAASSLYLVPAVAIVVAWIWLEELPGLTALVGGCIALAGVIVTNASRRAAAAPAEAAASQ